MKFGESARINRILIALELCPLCFFLFFSCTPNDRLETFSRALLQVDVLSANGKEKQALKKLASLRTEASGARQWMSIAKRERSMGYYPQAAITIRKALKQTPANLELTALLVDTLLDDNQVADACVFSPILIDSTFAPISAYAELIRASEADPLKIDPLYWNKAFEATGNPKYSRNAALMHAMSGNYSAASAAVISDDKIPNNAYFRALLAYDGGFYERVFYYLDTIDLASKTYVELSLMADSALRMGDIAASRLYWEECVTRGATVSPFPTFNLASTASSVLEMKGYLESCLRFFPAYYPAVVKFVRNVLPDNGAITQNAIRDELEQKGFISLDMHDAQRNAPIDREAAKNVLDKALSMPESAKDSRFLIEQFRFTQLSPADSVRSSSEMWKLLEKMPADPVLQSYAVWYFASIGNFDAAFALNNGMKSNAIPFYIAFEAVMKGDIETSEKSFRLVADNERDSWAALANIAQLHGKANNYEAAYDEFSLAAELSPDTTIKSELIFESAKILILMRFTDKAMKVLGYACELDPSNYPANMLLRELEAAR